MNSLKLLRNCLLKRLSLSIVVMAHVHTQPAADASTPMLRLQMYLPHARRRGVHNALPALPEFNWFFFGKKLFDEKSGHYFLQLDFPVQFLEVDTGRTYRLPPKIVGRFLIATSEKSNKEWKALNGFREQAIPAQAGCDSLPFSVRLF